MTTSRACGHALVLVLVGAVTVFINASSADRPLRRYDTALLPLLQTDNPYLLNGVDLRPEAMGAPLPLGQLRGQDLSGMDLRKALLSRRGLHSVRLRGAHLTQADFSCIPLEEVDLSGADLRETRFDFSACPPPLPARLTACPQEMGLPGSQPNSCFILDADLVGANLGGALLQGKVRATGEESAGPGNDPCEQWLLIRGRLNGARFEQATLRCVALINRPTSLLQKSSPAGSEVAGGSRQPGPPAYAGIRFVRSDLDHLLLLSGNFRFSDFWQARGTHLAVNLAAAHLGFSSLAQWQCPSEGCQLKVFPAGERARSLAEGDHLSLNVSGSRIRSDLPLPVKAGTWPALLCDGGTVWTPLPPEPTGSGAGVVGCLPGGTLVAGAAGAGSVNGRR